MEFNNHEVTIKMKKYSNVFEQAEKHPKDQLCLKIMKCFRIFKTMIKQTKKQIESGEALNLSTTRIIYNKGLKTEHDLDPILSYIQSM